MNLSGEQREKLQEALIDAFPDKSSLKRMLSFALDQNLNVIAGEGSLQEIVFQLITTAESQGWLLDLVRAARKSNPRNSSLQAIAQELLPNYYPQTLSVPSPNISSEQSIQQYKILVLAVPLEYKKNSNEKNNEEIQKKNQEIQKKNQEIQKEIDIIEEVIQELDKKDTFKVIKASVTSRDIIHDVIRKERPQIVHICGQGNEDGCLVFKDEIEDVPLKDFANLFKNHSAYINCVLLSSSYSSEAAKLISQDINYVIGMKQAIVKQAVIAFVKSFYDGLGCENSNNQSVIQKAFDQGLSASKEKGSKDLQSISIPVLRTKTQIEYYSWLINNYQKYQTEGLSKDCTLELPKVFVPLKIAPNYLENIHSELIWQVSNGTNNVREDQIWHRLVATVDEDQNNQACRRMVVLGGQGSGKSTLLKHLTLIYASEEQHQYHPQAPEFIPVLLLIRNLYQKIVENEKMSLADLIAEQVKQIIKEDQMIQPVSRWLIEELNRKKDNKCLIMLDGLDEVADETQRQQVSAWVDEQIQSYPNTTFILTSRPRGYKTASLKNVGIVLEAQPFKLDQIRSFIHKWYLETEKIRLYGDDILKIKKHAQQQAENLINRIRNSSQLAVMVVNPLLLTMITRLHHQLSINNRSLPEKRVELYKEMCEVLLEKRQKDKSIPDTLQVQDKQSVLQVLALKLMQQEKTEFKLADGTSWIKKQLTNVVSNQVNPKEFIEYIRDVSNFLVENDLKSYQFAHLSFQEYLAAYQIKEFNKEKLLISNIGNSWWAETIRLYAAQSDATKLIDAVLDMQSPSVDVMALAYDCLEESLKKVDDKVGQKLIRRLKEGLESTDPEIFKLAAQVTLIRRFRNFVPISEELEIDKSYITCAEYQLFLDETGEPRQSQHWQSKRFSAGDAKKPIRGISRENALRFCAWLGQKFGNQISEVATHYRLLTEEDLNQFEEEINQYSINNAQLFLESGIHLVKFQLPSIYSQLAYYLWCGEWQKADEETVKLMLEIAARKGRKSLNSQNIKKFTCEDLRIIDQLWVYASKGHFGFSVQKSIYQSLGGTGEDDDKIWTAFVDHIGWTREGGEWLECEGLIYDMNAPKGHLPVLNNEENMVVYLSEKFEQWWILSDPKVFSSLARKLKDCNITPGSRLQLPSEI